MTGRTGQYWDQGDSMAESYDTRGRNPSWEYDAAGRLISRHEEAGDAELPWRRRDFAMDSSGISSCRFVQWFSAKHSDPKLIESRDWIKLHLMCGTQTNVVTAVEISGKYRNDSPYFKPLVDATARNFTMREVSADKGYDSFENRVHALTKGATPYIPFREGAKNKPSASNKGELWKRMYHFYAYNTDRFMASYHKRSNVETTFHIIKSKFGDSVRSKTKAAQINEVLCKVLCHNICCLLQSMHELNLKPKFYQVA